MSSNHKSNSLFISHIMFELGWGKNEVERTRKAEMKKAEFLAADKAKRMF